jgi:hypothetical protein
VLLLPYYSENNIFVVCSFVCDLHIVQVSTI